MNGVGASRLYFVDCHREFSIYDVDFVPVPGADLQPPAVAGLQWFGAVQCIGRGRTDDWVAFHLKLLGCVMASPDGQWQWQLIEPQDAEEDGPEHLQRVAFGTADVAAAVAALRQRGVRVVETERLHPQTRGALTESFLGGVMFELVHTLP